MSRSKIEWTDRVWNPVTGCTKVSAGCKNCYAEGIAKRFWGERKFTDIILHHDRLEQPLHWKKPARVFVNSMSDLFHEDVPFEFIDKVFDIMYKARQHTFQILTKKPARLLEYSDKRHLDVLKEGADYWICPEHIWLGVSVENQEQADKRIPLLLQVPSKVKFLSIEPMLENIFVGIFLAGLEKLNWVIVGCESGPNRRECKIEWVTKIVDACCFCRVPVFVKQVQINGKVVKDINQFPADIRLRQYPRVVE